MHRRAWIGIIAVLAVLLHGAALVRHHAMMLSAGLSPGLAAELGVICAPGAPGGWSAASHNPNDPAAPHEGAPDCPVCCAHASVILARAADVEEALILWERPQAWPQPAPRPHLRLAAQPPPARGPPISV